MFQIFYITWWHAFQSIFVIDKMRCVCPDNTVQYLTLYQPRGVGKDDYTVNETIFKIDVYVSICERYCISAKIDFFVLRVAYT